MMFSLVTLNIQRRREEGGSRATNEDINVIHYLFALMLCGPYNTVPGKEERRESLLNSNTIPPPRTTLAVTEKKENTERQDLLSISAYFPNSNRIEIGHCLMQQDKTWTPGEVHE